MNNNGYIYIMANDSNNVLYLGVTNDLIQKIEEHKNKMVHGLINKFNITKLVYYEKYDDFSSALKREEELKVGSKEEKFKLVESLNFNWKDLYEDLLKI